MLYQTLVAGLVVGCLYGLAGLGLVVIYKTTRILNFAHGDITTFAMYIAFVLLKSFGLPYPVVFFLTLLAAGALAALIERVLIRPLYQRPHLDPVIVTLGIALVLNGVAVWQWGPDPRNLPLPVRGLLVDFGAARLNWGDALTLIASATLLLLTFLLFRYTRVGLAMRATFQNPAAARLMGIRSERIATLTWAISGVLAAAAGLFIAPLTYLDPFSITAFIIYSFAALVLGGFESPAGAVVGGILLGLLSNLIGIYVSTEFKASAIFAIMLLVLIVRPTGLFGSAELRRV